MAPKARMTMAPKAWKPLAPKTWMAMAPRMWMTMAPTGLTFRRVPSRRPPRFCRWSGGQGYRRVRGLGDGSGEDRLSEAFISTICGPPQYQTNGPATASERRARRGRGEGACLETEVAAERVGHGRLAQPLRARSAISARRDRRALAADPCIQLSVYCQRSDTRQAHAHICCQSTRENQATQRSLRQAAAAPASR